MNLSHKILEYYIVFFSKVGILTKNLNISLLVMIIYIFSKSASDSVLFSILLMNNKGLKYNNIKSLKNKLLKII